MFTVVSISGPVFYIDKFGQRVQLRIGDKVSDDTLLNSPDGNQVVLRSPAGDTLSFIVKEPQLVSHFSSSLPDQSPNQFDPSTNSSDSSISTSIRADATDSSQKLDTEKQEDTKSAQAQSDGHHHDTPAVVERTNLEIDNDTDSSVLSSRGLDSFSAKQDDALSNTINAQHDQLLANSSVHQDLPISITGIFDGSVSEDNQVSASGQLSIAGGPGSFASQSYQGQYGTLTIAPSGQWEYRLNSGATNVDALTDGQLVSEHFDIHAQNAGGVDFAHGLDIEITGTNDIAQITDATVGDVTEDSQLSAQGQLIISDKDSHESYFQQGDIQGAYGTLHLQQDGSWTYSLDNQSPTVQSLNAGLTVTDTLVIHSADGTSHQINIGVSGTNDQAIITGTDAGQVSEDTLLSAQGKLNVQDTDAGEAFFQYGDLQGQYGTLHLQKDGSWTYDLNNQDPAIQALGQGVQTSDTITVTSVEGASHTIKITIQGTNDAAVVTDNAIHGVKEDTNLHGKDLIATGQLGVTDTDTGEAFFQKEAIIGQYGTFSIDKDGTWQFHADNSQTAIQSLAAGQHITDMARIMTADGTPHDIVVTITGTSDHPNIHVSPADVTGSTIEDLTPAASGTLSAAAVDQTTALTWSLDHSAGKFGSLSIDPQTGQWNYSLGQGTGKQALLTQELSQNERHTEIFKATVTDSHGTTSTHDIVIHVQGTNDAPVLNAITARSTDEGNPTITGQITSSDVDNGDTAGYSTTANVAGFTLNSDGSYSFDPTNAAYNGLAKGDIQTITIPVTVTDHVGDTDTKNLVISVTGTNDNPVLDRIQAQSVNEDARAISGIITSSDVDAHETSTYTAPTVDGFALKADGSYTFDPSHSAYQHLAAGKDQTVTIPITVTDQDGGTDTQNLVITIHGTADAAVIGGTDSGSVTEETTLQATGSLSIADKDDGQAHFQDGDITTAHGVLRLSATGSWTYDLDNNNADVQALGTSSTGTTNSLTDTIQVQSADGTTHNIIVTISGTNDDPVMNAITARTATEGDASLTRGTITSSDTDSGDTASYSTPANVAGFSLNSDGSYTFDPSNAAYNSLGEGVTQKITIPVTVTDGSGGTDSKDLIITVTGTNDSPVLDQIQAQSATENGSIVSGTVTSSDIDSGDTARYSTTATVAGFSLNSDGNYTFDPNNTAYDAIAKGDTQRITIPITVTDGSHGTDTQNLVITITGTNDAPVIDAISAKNVTEDAGVLKGTITTSDPDAHETATYSTSSTVDGFTLNSDGTYSFNPSNGAYQHLAAGTDQTLTIPITVTDQEGITDTQNLVITVHGKDDAAVVTGTDSGAVTEGDSGDTATATGTLSISDVDTGQTPNFPDLASTATTYGHIAMVNGQWTYTLDQSKVQDLDPNSPDANKQQVTDSYTFTASDGTTQTVQISITGTNDAPTITPVALRGTEDTDYTFSASNFGFHDVDSGAALHHVTITTLPDASKGSLTLDGHAVTVGQDIATADISKLVFTPVTNTNGDVHIGFTVNDGVTDSSGATATLTIASVNDQPTVVATTSATNEDTDITLTKAQLLAGATDIEHDTLDIKSVHVDPAQGSITDNHDGTWTFHPATNFKGDADISYQVTDGTNDVNNHMTVDVATVTDAADIGLTTAVEQQIVSTGTSGRVQVDQIQGIGGVTEFTFETTVIGKAVPDTGASTGPVAINIGHGSNDNFLSLWNPGNMKIGGAGDVATGINLGDGNNHRVTMTWNSASGNLKIFDNGQLVTTVNNFHKGETMPSDLYMVLGQKANGGISGASWNQGEHYDGSIFNAAMADHALSPADIAKGPLASLVTKAHGLLFDVRSIAGHIQDTTGVHSLNENGVHHESHMVDTSISVPPPGALLHITPHVTPHDADDKVTDIEIQGLIKGTVLTDGTHTHTITGILDKVDLAGWQLDHMTAQLPSGIVHNMNIGVTATTEGPDGTQEVHTEFNGIKLDPTRPIPNAVIAGDDHKTTDEDSAVSGTLTVNDEASQQSFIATTYYGTHGDLTMQADGHWTYTPSASLNSLAAGAQVTDSITVESNDGTMHEIDLQINGTNDAPTITTSNISATEDAPYTFSATDFGFTDADTGDALDHVTITQLPDSKQGVLSLNGHAVTAGQDISASDIPHLVFTPKPDFNGDVDFAYTVNDGDVDSAEATGTLHVANVDDASVISGANTGTVTEGDIGDIATAQGQLTIKDIDTGDNPSFPDVASTATTYGHIAMVNGQWTYTLDQSKVQDLDPNDPDASKHQVTDSYTFTASDGSTQTVQIAITGTNDAPVIESAHAAPAGAHATSLKLQNLEVVDHPTGANIDTGADWGTEKTGAPAGWKIVGLYRPGSDHNYIDPAHSPSTDTAHSGNGGYNYIGQHGFWKAQGVPDTVNTGGGGAGGHGNSWQNGIVVFQDQHGDQHIGIINRVCSGSDGNNERDYLYYHSYQNLHPGAITLSGQAAANEHIEIKEGTHTVATATADQFGHWEVAASALPDGKHTLHVENGSGDKSAEHVYQITGTSVSDVTPAGLDTELKEDTSQTTINGELKVTDADHGDNPSFVAQANHATQYGHFSIDANGHYHYTIDNTNATVNALGVHQTLQEHITVTARTADGEVATHDVTVTINGSVDAPTLSASAATAQQGATIVLDLQASLTDTGGDHETLTVTIAGLPDNAVLNQGTHDTVAKTWTLTQAELKGLTVDLQNPSFHGDLHFNVTATASASGESESTTQSVSLFVNAPPTVASAITDTTSEDTAHHQVDLLQGASDSDTGSHATLSVTSVTYSVDGAPASSSLPDGFSLASDGHTLVMDQTHQALQSLARGEHRTIEVHYTIEDPDGGSVQQSATLTVNGTNDLPTLNTVASISRNEDGSVVHGQLVFSDTDTSDTHTFSTVDSLGHPVTIDGLTIHADGSYDFDPGDAAYQKLDEGEHLNINAKIVITDSSGGTAEQPLHISLVGKQDAPIVHSVSIPDQTEDRVAEFSESQVLSMLHITDADQEALHVASFNINAAAGHMVELGIKHGEPYYRFVPTHNFNGHDLPFTVDVTDGRDTVQASGTFNILAVNDLQRVGTVDLGDIDEDATRHITEAELLALTTDVDNPLSDMQVSNLHVDPSIGVISGDRLSGWTFTPNQDWNSGTGKLDLQFTVTDQTDTSNSVTGHAKLAVNPIQDSATIADQGSTQQAVIEDSAASVTSGRIAVTDPDGSAESALKTATQIDCTYGTVNLVKNPDGTYTWTYTLNNNSAAVQQLGHTDSVTDQFVVESVDGTQRTIHIQVHGSNDAPIVTSIGEYSVHEGEATLHGQITTIDKDTGDTAQFHLVNYPPAGFTFNQDGSYEFNPKDAAYNSLKEGEVRTISLDVIVSDHLGSTVMTKLQFEITGTNDQPTVSDVQLGTVSETAATPLHFTNQDLLAGSSDPDGDLLTIQEVHLKDNSIGRLIEDGHGGYTFEPNHALGANAIKALDINFKVSEQGSAQSYAAQAHFTVHGVNEAPIVETNHGDHGNYNFGRFEAGQLYSLSPDPQTLLKYVTDPESDKLSITGIKLVDNHGHALADQSSIVDNGDGTFTFSPTSAMAASHQAIHFEYQVSDGVNTITVKAHGAVDPVQHFHAFESTHATEDTVADASGHLTASKTDGTSLSFVAEHLTGSRYGGTLELHADGSYTYHLSSAQMQAAKVQALSQGHWGYDQFTATDSDGHKHNFHVRIAGADDASTIQVDAGSDQEVSDKESAVVTADGQLSIHDVDSDGVPDEFLAKNYIAGSFGHMQLDPTGHYTYTLDNTNAKVLALSPSDKLIDHLTVETKEGVTQQIEIIVHGANDAPVINAMHAQQTSKGGAELHGQVDAVDPDKGDTISFQIARGLSAPAGFTLNADGSYSFDPSNAAYQGVVAGTKQLITIPIEATDSHGAHSVRDLIITVSGGNSVPTADAHVHVADLTEDTPVTFNERALLNLAHAADADHDQLHVTSLSVPSHIGTITDDGRGHFTFTPAKDFNADNVVFSFKVSDGQTTTTVQATADIKAVNDPAVVDPFNLGTIQEEGAKHFSAQDLLSHAHDVEGDTLQLSGVPTVDPKYGTITGDAASGFVFTPAANYFGNNIPIRFAVSDGTDTTQAQTSINVHGVADKATFTEASSQFVQEDTKFTAQGKIDVHDPDGSAQEHFKASNNIAGTYGYLAIGVNGNWSYHLNHNHVSGVQGLADGEKYVEHFTLHSSDGTRHVLNVEILGTQDAASITGHASASINEDTAQVSGSLSVHDADISESHFTAQASIAGSFGHLSIAENGAWTYVLDNSLSKTQALNDGDTRTETFTVSSADGSASKDIVVTIHGQNDAPVISSAVTLPAGTEDQSATITAAQLLANATDVDTGETLSITSLSADHGTITKTGAGTWSFTPDTDYNGVVQLSYKVVDSHHGETSATATMALAGTEDAPVVRPTSASTTEDVSGGLVLSEAQLLVGSSDADNDALTVKNLHIPSSQGVLTDNGDGTWTLTPASNFHGDISLTYDVSDGKHDIANSMTVSVSSVVDAASIATSATPSGNEDTAIALNLDVTEHGDSLQSITITGFAAGTSFSAGHANGTGVWVVDASDVAALTMTPPTYFHGAIGLSVTATTGDGNSTTDSSPQTVSVNVDSVVNAASIATSSAPSGNEDSAIALNLNVTEHGDALQSITITGFAAGTVFSAGHANSTGGWVVDAADVSALTMTPPTNFNGTVALSVVATTGDGNTTTDSAPQAISVTVDSVVDVASIATSSAPSGNEDSAIALNLDITEHGDALQSITITGFAPGTTFSSGHDNGSGGWVVDAADVAALTMTPPTNFNGTLDLSVVATTGDGSSTTNSFAETVSVNVDSVVDAAGVATSSPPSGKEDSAIALNLDVTEHGDALQSVTIEGFAAGTAFSAGHDNGSGGWVVDAADVATLTMTPPNNFNGTVSLDITATTSDGHSTLDSATQSIDVAVQAVNDAAQIDGTTSSSSSADLTEDDASHRYVMGKLTLSDQDQGESSFQAIPHQKGTYGRFELTSDGHWTYTLDNSLTATQALNASHGGTETFTITSPDGTATHTLTINVAGTNDAPEVSYSAASIDVSNTTQTTINLTLTDVDSGDTVSAKPITNGASSYGHFSINAAGQITYQVDPDNPSVKALGDGEGITDKFTISVIDNHGAITTKEISVSVLGENDAPQITAIAPLDLGFINEDATLKITTAQLLANVQDADSNDVLSIQSVSVDSRYGSVTDNHDGTFTFTPKTDFYGSDVPLKYVASDGTGTVSGTASVDVHAMNDGPIWDGNLAFTKTGDGTWSIDMSVGAHHGGISAAAGEEVQHLYLRGFLKGTVITDGTHTWTQTQDNLQNDAWKDPANSNPDGIKGYDSDGNTQYDWKNGVKVDSGVVSGVTDQMANQHACDIAGWDWSKIQITVPPGTYPHAYTWTASEWGVAQTIQGHLTFNSGDHADAASISEDGVASVAGFIDAHPSDGIDVGFTAQSVDGNYGHFDLQADGTWKYTLDQAKADSLNDGDQVTDVFHATTTNGESHDITLTIDGHTDTVPSLSPGIAPIFPSNIAADEPVPDDGSAQTSDFTVVEDATFTFSDEPQLNLAAAHEERLKESSADKTDQKAHDLADDRAAAVLGGASENEANDALQTMIEEHLTAHHESKVKDEANIATKSDVSEHSDDAQSQTDLTADSTAPDESVGGSSSSHLDSLVAKPDDDSLPPI